MNMTEQNDNTPHLMPITLKEANDFVSSYHRHNGRTSNDGGKFAIACGTESLGLIGVAIVGRPLARMLDDGWTAEVLRCCICPEAIKNTPSMLYGASWRAWKAMGGKRIVTYTLTTESGSSLRGAGWKVIAECKGGGWSRPNLNRVRNWQPIYGQQKMRWEMS